MMCRCRAERKRTAKSGTMESVCDLVTLKIIKIIRETGEGNHVKKKLM